MADEKLDRRVRITNQFRSGQAMVYDLSCEETRLTVRMTSRPNDDGLGEWTAEAHSRQSPERPTVAEPGATRSDALRAVARSWEVKNGRFGFPTLDWESIARALTDVRAI
jgi:hypothetical protein